MKSRSYRAYAVLTMCRILYTLAKGEIVSKPVAARWAMEKLDETWTKLIEHSLNWSKKRVGISPEQTLAFVNFTVKQSGGFSPK